jgi:hypothetical protein
MSDLPEFRQTQRENNIQISKLWTAHRELATVTWGDDKTRDNGLRSRVESLESSRVESAKDSSDLREQLRHYLDVERRETCHGISALEVHEREYFQKLEEANTVKVARIQASAQTKGAKITGLAGVLIQLITAAGVFYALIIK